MKTYLPDLPQEIHIDMDPLVTKPSAIYSQFTTVVDSFDFDRVAKIMELLDFKWFGETKSPTAHELKGLAYNLFFNMDKTQSGNCHSGGLCWTYFMWGETTQLSLMYIAESTSVTDI